jgi:hypothetical protein
VLVMHERGIAILLLMMVLAGTSGCSTIGAIGTRLSRIVTTSEQQRNLSAALDSLRAGKEQQARDKLELVVEAPSVAEVTDEALFRLALLYLGNEGGKGAARAKLLLDRLKNEFPGSLWTRQAVPLDAYLAGGRNFRDREIRALRELNLSLSRDNKELRQSIERLKNLDMELEQRIKR